jgi:hypothetical protein
MISKVILVHAEFDIARGCRTLRGYAADQDWKPIIGARATAALTALGDLILNSGANELVPVNIAVKNYRNDQGIELGCSFYSPNTTSPNIEAAKQRLQRATDELDIYETAGNVQVTARLIVT